MTGLLEGRRLFWIVTFPIGAVMALATIETNPADGGSVSSMIQLSVRLSVPWLYLAFIASSVQQLLPGSVGRWLVRNRRILGLCFAGGMAWPLFFIGWMVLGHPEYYRDEVYLPADLAIQVMGYAFLVPMTLTSFKPFRRRLSRRQWRRLHTVGIYFLWATVWSTYWYELFYYDDIQPIDYFYYWAGFLAWGVRLLAWGNSAWRSVPAPGARKAGPPGAGSWAS